jgi:hypothetical protein
VIVVIPFEGGEVAAERVASTAATRFDTLVAHSPTHLRSLRSSTWCAIAVSQTISEPMVGWIATVLDSAGCVPTLVTSVETHRRISHFFPPEIHGYVALHELEAALATHVMQARVAGIRAQVRLAVALDHGLTALARRGAHAAARAAPPFCEVAAVASAIGCSRSGLWKAWHSSVGSSRPRFEDLLQWLRVLAALGKSASGTNWLRVAEDLGVHEHTLSRIVHRLYGVGLRELASSPEIVFAADAVRERLSWLFGPNVVDEMF